MRMSVFPVASQLAPAYLERSFPATNLQLETFFLLMLQLVALMMSVEMSTKNFKSVTLSKCWPKKFSDFKLLTQNFLFVISFLFRYVCYLPGNKKDDCPMSNHPPPEEVSEGDALTVGLLHGYL